jgi:hypothetical protein
MSVLGQFMMHQSERAIFEAIGGAIGFLWLSRARVLAQFVDFDDDDGVPAPATQLVTTEPRQSTMPSRMSGPKSFGKRR